jgi:hypothetical protein
MESGDPRSLTKAPVRLAPFGQGKEITPVRTIEGSEFVTVPLVLSLGVELKDC